MRLGSFHSAWTLESLPGARQRSRRGDTAFGRLGVRTKASNGRTNLDKLLVDDDVPEDVLSIVSIKPISRKVKTNLDELLGEEIAEEVLNSW